MYSQAPEFPSYGSSDPFDAVKRSPAQFLGPGEWGVPAFPEPHPGPQLGIHGDEQRSFAHFLELPYPVHRPLLVVVVSEDDDAACPKVADHPVDPLLLVLIAHLVEVRDDQLCDFLLDSHVAEMVFYDVVCLRFVRGGSGVAAVQGGQNDGCSCCEGSPGKAVYHA